VENGVCRKELTLTDMKRFLLGFVVAVFIMVSLSGAEPVVPSGQQPPERFSSLKLLDEWVADCFGGGWSTKFTTRWKGNNVELRYTIRTFTSGLPSMEVTFWRPDGEGGWIKTVGTSVMDVEFKVNTSFGGVSLDAYESSTKSWVHWMTISTPMLCNGMPDIVEN